MDLLPSQLDFPGEVGEIATLTAAETSPAFSGCTGEQRAKIRRMRDSILELTAAGVGVKRAADALGISPQAVRAVRAAAWLRGELDPMKERLGREYLATADLLRAAALERIDEIPAQVLLLASAQAADKGQLLTGGATARIERAPVAAVNLHDLIDSLPAAERPVELEEAAPNKEPAARPAMGGPVPDSGPNKGPEVDTADTSSPAFTSETTLSVSPCVSREGSP